MKFFPQSLCAVFVLLSPVLAFAADKPTAAEGQLLQTMQLGLPQHATKFEVITFLNNNWIQYVDSGSTITADIKPTQDTFAKRPVHVVLQFDTDNRLMQYNVKEEKPDQQPGGPGGTTAGMVAPGVPAADGAANNSAGGADANGQTH